LEQGDYAIRLSIGSSAHDLRFTVAEFPAPTTNEIMLHATNGQFKPDQFYLKATNEIGEPLSRYTFEIRGGDIRDQFSGLLLNPRQTWELGWGPSFHGERFLNEEGTFAKERENNQYFDIPYEVPESLQNPNLLDLVLPLPEGEKRVGYEVTIDRSTRLFVDNIVVTAGTINLSYEKRVYAPGDPIKLEIQTVDFNGIPLPNRELKLNIGTWYLSEITEDPYIASPSDQYLTLKTGADGRLTHMLTDLPAGSHGIEVIGTQLLAGTASLLVAENEATLTKENRLNLLIEAEKEAYLPGETAILWIESAFDGPALLTVERGTIRSERLIELTSPYTRVALPISDTDAPNLFVSVTAHRANFESEPGGAFSTQDVTFYGDTVEINVPAHKPPLNVAIEPIDADGSYQVRVTNAAGDPISAEIGLSLADINTYFAARSERPSLYDQFYAPRDLQLKNYFGFMPTRYLGDLPWGCDGGSFSGILLTEYINPNLSLPHIQTDFSGEATLELPLSLDPAIWVIRAAAVTADTQIGEGYLLIDTRSQN
ncbi:MAG: hypothetical protein AAF633_16865, partial [Chloroflexota bacterium]